MKDIGYLLTVFTFLPPTVKLIENPALEKMTMINKHDTVSLNDLNSYVACVYF